MAHRKQAWSKRVRKERFSKKYLTRMQATRLLQLDSIHFRRLCILKGIYPRALARSKQKQSGNEKQYYLAREIKWLVHDQLSQKMFALRAWEKKVKRAEAMGRSEVLGTLQQSHIKPQHSLVASIKERYPYFVDAVRDIDDAMSTIALYAFLPPEVASDSTIETHHVLTSGMHNRARALCEEWNAYVARAKVLSKAFISIKGYYYEAIVKGERVRWLCPHEYAHKFPSGIQQYVMLSFLEFQLELMKFVLFKLQADLRRAEEAEAEAQGDGAVVPNTDAEDFSQTAVTIVDGNPQHASQHKEAATKASLIQQELAKAARVFDGLTFYLSREVPAKHARLVIESGGGRVVESYHTPAQLTHVVMDRPSLPPDMARHEQLEYVQPQYLFDCLNARTLLPVHGYRLGEELPPHVSPFTVSITNQPEDNAAVEQTRKDHPRMVNYVPARVHEIRKILDPSYVPIDAVGSAAQDLSEEDEDDYNRNEDEASRATATATAASVPELDEDDDVSLSGDELTEARREQPSWQDEEVSEHVTRSTLSALKVRKQREMNLANAPTSEVVARRRLAMQKARAAEREGESREARVQRRLTEMSRQEAATRKMQLQVARKKAARYYKMVNGVVVGAAKKASMLQAKAKQIEEGRLKPTADGAGLVNQRLAAKQQRAEARGVKRKAKKADNPYKRLPKWVQ